MTMPLMPDVFARTVKWGSLSMRPLSNHARTDFDIGRQRIRRRFTTIYYAFKYTHRMKKDAYEAWREFYEQELNYGQKVFESLVYTGVDYRLVQAQFMDDYDAAVPYGGEEWDVSVSIMVYKVTELSAAEAWFVGLLAGELVPDANAVHEAIHVTYPSITEGIT